MPASKRKSFHICFHFHIYLVNKPSSPLKLILFFFVASFTLLSCVWELKPDDTSYGIVPQAKFDFALVSGTRTPVVLTYDDGVQSQLDNAIPQLNSFGFRGTFFLNAISEPGKLAGFSAAAQVGHELGNHTLNHPCPLGYNWPPDQATERYDSARYISELATMQTRLQQLDGYTGQRSYAHPCSYHRIGLDSQSVVPLLESSNLINYARTGGSARNVILPFVEYDPMLIPALGVVDGTSSAQLIDFIEEADSVDGAAVIMFHGIGGDYINVTDTEHEVFLTYLRDNSSRFEVITFGELGKRMDLR